jgi:hypothetical protein
MCIFRKCRLLHSGPQINNAAAFVSMNPPFRSAQLHHLLSTGRRLLHLGIGYLREGYAYELLFLNRPDAACEGASVPRFDSGLKVAAMSLNGRANDGEPNPPIARFVAASNAVKPIGSHRREHSLGFRSRRTHNGCFQSILLCTCAPNST